MIVIVNISKDTFGECEYEVRINQKVITTFKHRREDGLSVCLRKAHEAVARQKWLKMAELIKGDK